MIIFEYAPAFISIVDKDLKIIRANQKYRDTFGGNHSIFFVEKSKRKKDYESSPTVSSFNKSMEFTDTHLVNTMNGERIQLIVTSIPYLIKDGKTILVMEIFQDITEINKLQEQLHNTHEFYNDLIENSADGIIAIDTKSKIQLFNSSLKNIMGWSQSRKPSMNFVKDLLPKEFFNDAENNGTIVKNHHTNLNTVNDEKVPVKMNAFEIRNKKKSIGKVAFFQDLRDIHNLEKQKSDAQRDALQTSINLFEHNSMRIKEEKKNLLAEFDKIISSNMGAAEKENAWRNVKFHHNFIDTVIENFLQFSLGYIPVNVETELEEFIKNIVSKYSEIAEYYNVSLNINYLLKQEKTIIDNYLLENIIGILLMNSIDSVRNKSYDAEVKVQFEDYLGNLVILVSDNGPSIKEIIDESASFIKEKRDMRIGIMTVKLISDIIGSKFEIFHDELQGNIYRLSY